MLNPIEAYAEAGRKAAEARNDGDEARAQFHAEWFRRARNLEQGDGRRAANEAYRVAYTTARRI